MLRDFMLRNHSLLGMQAILRPALRRFGLSRAREKHDRLTAMPCADSTESCYHDWIFMPRRASGIIVALAVVGRG